MHTVPIDISSVELSLENELNTSLKKIKDQFGYFDKFIELQSIMENLKQRIETLPENTECSLVVGYTGAGKSTMLGLLDDLQNLLLESKEPIDFEQERFNDDKEMYTIQQIDGDEKIREVTLTPSQYNFYIKNNWLVLDSDKFKIGHSNESATLLPNYATIKTNNGSNIVCFDLAGFGDNRGFLFKVIIDSMLHFILNRFTFRRFFCVCAQSTLIERANTDQVIQLKDTLESIGLVDVLQMIIVKHKKPPKKQGKSYKKYTTYLRDELRKSLTIPDNSQMTPRGKNSYAFFLSHIDKAIFLSYKHFAKEARDEILRIASSGPVITSKKTNTFSSITLFEMKSFFEYLIGFCVSKPAEQLFMNNNNLNELRKKMENLQQEQKNLELIYKSNLEEKTRIDKMKISLLEKKKNLMNEEQRKLMLIKECEEAIAGAVKNLSSYQSVQVELNTDLAVSNKEKSIFYNEKYKINEEISQHQKKGENEYLHTCSHTFTRRVSCSYSCKCDSISALSPDKSSFEIISKSMEETESKTELRNCNWYYDAHVVVSYTGKKKYQEKWKNKLKELNYKLDKCFSDINIKENKIKSLCENIHENKDYIQTYTKIKDEKQKKLNDLNKRELLSNEDMIKDDKKEIDEACSSLNEKEKKYKDKVTENLNQVQNTVKTIKEIVNQQHVLLTWFREKVFKDITGIRNSRVLQVAMMDNHKKTWEMFLNSYERVNSLYCEFKL